MPLHQIKSTQEDLRQLAAKVNQISTSPAEEKTVEDLKAQCGRLIISLLVTAYRLGRSDRVGKALTLLAKLESMGSALYENPTDPDKLTQELRTTLVRAAICREAEFGTQPQTIENLTQYLMYASCPYSVLVYLTYLTLEALKQNTSEQFYNRSRSLNDFLVRTLQKKLHAPFEEFLIAQVISMKSIDPEICNKQLYQAIVSTAMFFHSDFLRKDGLDDSKADLIEKNSLKMAGQVSVKFLSMIEQLSMETKAWRLQKKQEEEQALIQAATEQEKKSQPKLERFSIRVHDPDVLNKSRRTSGRLVATSLATHRRNRSDSIFRISPGLVVNSNMVFDEKEKVLFGSPGAGQQRRECAYFRDAQRVDSQGN